MPQLSRHCRQTILPEIGEAGQRALAGSTVLVVGCGALGTHCAELLVRAGVGCVQILDRDLVELSNLQRQVLFDQRDADRRAAKAIAAASRLRAVDPTIEIRPFVVDLTSDDVEDFVEDVDLVVDGTDNLETRYLLNDACARLGKPWVYGGVIGTDGVMMAVVPGEGPCLRCLFPDPPPPGTLPTCDTAGVLNTAPAVIAALQVTAALRILLGDAPTGELVQAGLWDLTFRKLHVTRDPDCPCCGRGDYVHLERRRGSTTQHLCGRNAVQISPPPGWAVPLEELAQRLRASAEVEDRGHLIEVRVEGGLTLLVFRDGRTVVEGTDDHALARACYARYVAT